MVGRAVYKTEQKPKVNGIFKDSQHTVVEVNGEKSTDGVIKDHRARLRKSSRPQDSTEAPVKSTNGLDDAQSDGIITDHRARLRKTSRPDGNEEHSKATKLMGGTIILSPVGFRNTQGGYCAKVHNLTALVLKIIQQTSLI